MRDKMTNIKISTEYITLGQVLQKADLIQTGGMAKWFLQEYTVWVNDSVDNRRGRKCYPGDQIKTEASDDVFVVTG